MTPATASMNFTSSRLDVREGDTGDLAQVAAHPVVDETGARPFDGLDPALGLPARHLFEDDLAQLPHQDPGARDCRVDVVLAHEPPSHEVAGGRFDRVARAPGGLLLLRPVPERAAGEWAVLVEVSVDVGLDEGRPTAGAHVPHRLLGGKVDRQRVHPVDLPARDPEARTPS